MPVATEKKKYVHDAFFVGDIEVAIDGVIKAPVSKEASAKSLQYLPTWDPKEKVPSTEFHVYEDPALRADPSFSNLLSDSSKIKPLTPKLGSEITGVQLSELSDAAKNELALLAAQRGVLIFRDQDLLEKGPSFVSEYASYFGKLHVHPNSASPAGHPEATVVYKDWKEGSGEIAFKEALTSTYFHQDVTFDLQPSGYTFFGVLETPEVGGDTIFVDSFEAFDRLSPALQEYLSGLHAVHDIPRYWDINGKGNTGNVERYKAQPAVHPVVRVHPVLKRKVLNVNKGFTKRIVELKPKESENLLQFLNQFIDSAHDLQLRANWTPGTVVIWDNRRVHHGIVVDFEDTGLLRHHVRFSSQAERPVEDLKYLNDPSYYPKE